MIIFHYLHARSIRNTNEEYQTQNKLVDEKQKITHMVIIVSNILGAEIEKILIHVDKLLQMVTLGSILSSK